LTMDIVRDKEPDQRVQSSRLGHGNAGKPRVRINFQPIPVNPSFICHSRVGGDPLDPRFHVAGLCITLAHFN
jgi:hypothetical protein